MTCDNLCSTEEIEIRQLIVDKANAICSKDIPRLVSQYADGAVIYDLKPPFQITGIDSIHELWETGLGSFPDFFEMVTKDLRICMSGDLALAHWLFCFTGKEESEGMQAWMRATIGYHRVQGIWKIVHEHCSVPFNPDTGKVVFTLDT